MDFKDTIKVLKRAHRAKKTVMLQGNHGIGKSAAVYMYYKMLCKLHGEENVGFEDIRLSEREVGDLIGIPFRVLGQTYFAPPNWYPVHPVDGKRIDSWLTEAGEHFKPLQSKPYGVLILDEFNRSAPDVQQASFELANDRRLGGIHVPDGWLIVAAMNEDKDCYTVNDLDAALLNRFIVVKFTPSREDWYRYAEYRVEADIMHSSVLAFLHAHGEKMDPTKEDIMNAARKGSPLYTRRSWTNLGEFLWTPAGEQDPTDFVHPGDEGWLMETAIGFLGVDVARAYVNFIRSDYRTLTASEVLDSWGPKAHAYIRKLVGEGRVHELTGGVVRGVLDELKRRPPKITGQLALNILSFASILPGEVVTDMYQQWASQDRGQSDSMYDYVSLDASGNPEVDPVTKRKVCPFKTIVYNASSRKAAVGAMAGVPGMA